MVPVYPSPAPPLFHGFPSYDTWPWIWLMIEQSRFAVLQFPALQMTEHVLKPTPVLNWTHLLWRLPSAARTILNWALQEHKPGPEAATAKSKPDSRQEAGMGSGKGPRTASFNRVFFWRDCWRHYLINLQQDHPSMSKVYMKNNSANIVVPLSVRVAPTNLWPGCYARKNLSLGQALFLH